MRLNSLEHRLRNPASASSRAPDGPGHCRDCVGVAAAAPNVCQQFGQRLLPEAEAQQHGSWTGAQGRAFRAKELAQAGWFRQGRSCEQPADCLHGLGKVWVLTLPGQCSDCLCRIRIPKSMNNGLGDELRSGKSCRVGMGDS